MEETKKGFREWLEQTLTSIHRQAYKAPPVKRVWIPKPGKKEKRLLGVPCIDDRALQRSVADVLNAIHEQDFLPCSMQAGHRSAQYCTRNLKGNFMVGLKAEKTRLWRSFEKLKKLLRRIRHDPSHEQLAAINRRLQGHYAYCGMGGNCRSLCKLYRFEERYWRKMLSKRCRRGKVTWEEFNHLKRIVPLQRPKITISFWKMQLMSVL